MAYAFNNVMGMMDKDRQNQGSSNPQISMSQGLQKNAGTDEGAQSATGGGTSNTAAKAPQDFTKSNFNSAKTILDRNKGVQQTGIEGQLTMDAQQKAQQNVANINQSSNQYAQDQSKKAEDLYKSPDRSTVNNAVSGNTDAYQNISNTLNGPVGKVDDWKSPELQAAEAQDYTRANDITGLLMNQGGQDYNKGMASLDNLQFKQTGGNQRVNQRINDLNNQVTGTLNSANDQQFGVQANAQKALEARAKQTQDAIRAMLGSSQNDIKNAVMGRETDLDQKVHNQAKEASSAGIAGLQARIDNAVNDVKSKMAASSPDQQSAYQNVLDQFGKLNAKNYVDQVLPHIGFNETVNQQEADNLNRINALLGSTDKINVNATNPMGTANIRTNNFDPEFQRIMSMIPAFTPAGPNQAPIDNAANQSAQRVVSTLPGNQIQPANKDVATTIGQMLGSNISSTPNKNKAANYNPFKSLGMG